MDGRTRGPFLPYFYHYFTAIKNPSSRVVIRDVSCKMLCISSHLVPRSFPPPLGRHKTQKTRIIVSHNITSHTPTRYAFYEATTPTPPKRLILEESQMEEDFDYYYSFFKPKGTLEKMILRDEYIRLRNAQRKSKTTTMATATILPDNMAHSLRMESIRSSSSLLLSGSYRGVDLDEASSIRSSIRNSLRSSSSNNNSSNNNYYYRVGNDPNETVKKVSLSSVNSKTTSSSSSSEKVVFAPQSPDEIRIFRQQQENLQRIRVEQARLKALHERYAKEGDNDEAACLLPQKPRVRFDAVRGRDPLAVAKDKTSTTTTTTATNTTTTTTTPTNESSNGNERMKKSGATRKQGKSWKRWIESLTRKPERRNSM